MQTVAHVSISTMLDLSHKKIVVTGGSGFLGSHVLAHLRKQGATQIFVPRSKEYDLREKEVCKKLVAGQDLLIHIAAHVGGIGLNKEHPGQLFYDNASMGIHLLEEARQAGVAKMLIVGTACSYPKYCPVPFSEENLWEGYPDEVTGVYGLAKKMLLVQAQAYRQEYGFNAIYLLPVNLYGPGDNFDLKSSHVIPALIKRFVEARESGASEVVVWGTGKPTREFLYVEDAAEAIILSSEKYNGADPVNLGSGSEISIRELAEGIKKLGGYRGEIVLGKTKPDGQPRRRLDGTRAKNEFGFKSRTSFEIGLKKTVEWFARQKRELFKGFDGEGGVKVDVGEEFNVGEFQGLK